MQVMRHKASHLGPMENLTLEDVERLRQEQERNLRELEDKYMRKREAEKLGISIKDMYSHHEEKYED